ncbi:MAG: proteasome assembly chaperone family protein [archaeon]
MIIWNVIEKPKLRNPILVEGLPGIGNVGKVASEYFIEKLKAKKFAELYSDHYPYHVFVNEDDTIDLPRNEFYYYRSKKKGEPDLIIITGDIQSMTPHGHYEIVKAMLDFVKPYGVKQMYTLGGFGVPVLPKTPKVIGAVTQPEFKKKYEKLGVKFEKGERVGIIIGASGLLLGLGKIEGVEGICLMGETLSRPMFTDAKAAKHVLLELCKLLKLRLDMKDLDERSVEMDRAIAKAREIEKSMISDSRGGKPDEFRYIG